MDKAKICPTCGSINIGIKAGDSPEPSYYCADCGITIKANK